MAEYIDRQEIIDTINAHRSVAANRKDFIGMRCMYKKVVNGMLKALQRL